MRWLMSPRIITVALALSVIFWIAVLRAVA